MPSVRSRLVTANVAVEVPQVGDAGERGHLVDRRRPARRGRPPSPTAAASRPSITTGSAPSSRSSRAALSSLRVVADDLVPGGDAVAAPAAVRSRRSRRRERSLMHLETRQRAAGVTPARTTRSSYYSAHGHRESGLRPVPAHRGAAACCAQAVRELAEDKIAPRAAEIDETAEFPYDVLDALVRAGFHAVHIPEEYGGAGRRRDLGVHRRRGGRPGLRVVLAHPGGEQARARSRSSCPARRS